MHGERDMPQKPTFSAEEYTKVKEKMLHLEKEFVLLRGKATEGKKAQEDLMKLIRKHNTSAQKEEKCLKTIRKVNNVIAKQSAYNLLDTYITGMTTEKVQQINMLSEDADQNMLQTLAISGAVYTAMIEAIVHDPPRSLTDRLRLHGMYQRLRSEPFYRSSYTGLPAYRS